MDSSRLDSALPTCRLFTRKTLAQYLSCSEDSIDRLVRAGDLVAVRVGAAGVRFRPEDVQAYLDRNAVVVIPDSMRPSIRKTLL